MEIQSKITGGPTEYIFTATVLNKYPVKYYRCTETGFIQTEHTEWLGEAYNSAITSLDLGLVSRNIKLADVTEKIIGENLDGNQKFIDYAGGYGMFTRIMRDKGYDFYHTDKYCDNLFAKHFDVVDLQEPGHFELVTAFEVFDHFADPLAEIQKIKNYSDTIFFSTKLVPNKKLASAEDWWYIAPESGKHIAFYTREALQYIATKSSLNFYTNNVDLHLLTSKKLPPDLFKEISHLFSEVPLRKGNAINVEGATGFKKLKLNIKKFRRRWKERKGGKIIEARNSLLEKDYKFVKALMNKFEA